MSEDIYFPCSFQGATLPSVGQLWKYISNPHFLWALSQWAPPDKMKQSVTSLSISAFSPPQLSRNTAWKWSLLCGWSLKPMSLSFLYLNRILAFDKAGRTCPFPESRNCLFCMKSIGFALVKGANKRYPNVRMRSEGDQSSQTVRIRRGNTRASEMESGQKLASTLSQESNQTQPGNFKINGGRKKNMLVNLFM